MKYYLIAGEASGDLHASNLMKNLKMVDANAEFRYFGGDLMREQGGTLVKHYREISFMGFQEILLHLPVILKNIEHCKQDIIDYKPDIVIPVDFPGFNLRIARFLKTRGLKSINPPPKIFYYISPQVWAWNSSRVHRIKKIIDRMFVILPFEKDFYRKFEMEVDYVGHPLLDVINEAGKSRESIRKEFLARNELGNEPIIAVLPGSRIQEIEKMLPVMLSAGKEFKNYRLVIGGLASVPAGIYEKFLAHFKSMAALVYNDSYPLLLSASAAMVTSGTATLEAALFGVPEVVCYKGNIISFMIAKKLVNVNFISLVNLVMGRKVVSELIQNEFTVKNLKSELLKITGDEKNIRQMKSEFLSLREKLGSAGASMRVAGKIIEYMGMTAA